MIVPMAVLPVQGCGMHRVVTSWHVCLKVHPSASVDNNGTNTILKLHAAREDKVWGCQLQGQPCYTLMLRVARGASGDAAVM